MLGRTQENGRLGGDGAVIAATGGKETEMGARSSREEIERVANSAGNARAAPVTVGSIDTVVASDNAPAGKQGGERGNVRYA